MKNEHAFICAGCCCIAGAMMVSLWATVPACLGTLLLMLVRFNAVLDARRPVLTAAIQLANVFIHVRDARVLEPELREVAKAVGLMGELHG